MKPVPGSEWCDSTPAETANLRLLSDLRLRREGEMAASVHRTLFHIDGVYSLNRKWSNFWLDFPDDDGRLNFIEGGIPPTRDEIRGAIADLVVRSERVSDQTRDVLVVFYVSAHGLIGADGKSYVLPSDADQSQPATWLSYDEIIGPLKAFVSAAPSGSERRAFVVFDTCRKGGSGSPDDATMPVDEHIFVVESASPGQYAWHWASKTTVERTVEISKDTRWTIPFSETKEQAGSRTSQFLSRMSVLPVANNCALSSYFGREPADEEEDTIGDYYGLDTVSWLALTSGLLRHAMESIPEARKLDERQTMRASSARFGIFRRQITEVAIK